MTPHAMHETRLSFGHGIRPLILFLFPELSVFTLCASPIVSVQAGFIFS